MEDSEDVRSCSSSVTFYTSPNSPTHYPADCDLVEGNDAAAIFLLQEGYSLPKLCTWDLSDLAASDMDRKSNSSSKDANSFRHDHVPKVAPIETEYFPVSTKSKTSPHSGKLDVFKRIFRLGGLRSLSGDKKEPLRRTIPTENQPFPTEKNPILAEKKTIEKPNSTQKDENFKQGRDAGKLKSVTSQSKDSGKPSTFSKIFRLEGIRKLWRGKKSTLALPEATVSNEIKDGQPPVPVGNDSTSDEIVNLKRNDENSNRKGLDAGYHSVLSHSNSVKRLEEKLSSHSQRRPDNQLVTNFSKKHKGKLNFLYKIIKPGKFGKFWKGSNSRLLPEGQQEDKPVPKFEGFGENGAPSTENKLSEVFDNVRFVRNDEEKNDSTELVRTRSVRKSTEINNSMELVRIRSARKSTELRLQISRSMRSTDFL